MTAFKRAFSAGKKGFSGSGQTPVCILSMLNLLGNKSHNFHYRRGILKEHKERYIINHYKLFNE